MNTSDLIKKLALGAFVGCFIVMFIMVLMSLESGPQNISFDGVTIINAFLGSIVVGWGFSLTGMIYEKDDIPFPIQIAFQMGIGMVILFAMAIYLQWMPVNFGIGAIVEWVVIACIFAAVFWFGFYFYYYLLARELNNRLDN